MGQMAISNYNNHVHLVNPVNQYACWVIMSVAQFSESRVLRVREGDFPYLL